MERCYCYEKFYGVAKPEDSEFNCFRENCANWVRNSMTDFGRGETMVGSKTASVGTDMFKAVRIPERILKVTTNQRTPMELARREVVRLHDELLRKYYTAMLG